MQRAARASVGAGTVALGAAATWITAPRPVRRRTRAEVDRTTRIRVIGVGIAILAVLGVILGLALLFITHDLAVVDALADRGGLWIAWPKKTSGVASDLTEPLIRALGLEAASRGAKSVQLVEQDAGLVQALQSTVQRLKAADQVTVRRGDGIAWLKGLPAASVDLVLLDPPFDANLFEAALAAARPCLRASGWLYLEAPQAWREEALAPLGYGLHRHLKAGAVHAHLLQPLP